MTQNALSQPDYSGSSIHGYPAGQKPKTIFKSTLFMTDLRKKRFAKASKNLTVISLRDAAKQMCISPATLSRIEHGNLPDLLTYARACKWLGKKMDYYIKTK